MDSTAPHNHHPAYRPDIDGLRAVAILAVVAFHAFPSLLRGGFIGVDIFFVISGFLISSIIFRSLQRGDFSFADFYARRIRRIFPALIVVLVACYTFGWLALLPDEYRQLGKHMVASAGFVQNLVLWKEAGYFDGASELKPLMHLWSLAVEEQFYLIYPLLIWGAWRIGLNLLTIVVAIGLLSFGLNLNGVETNAVKTFFLPQTRFWELLAGSVLAHVTSSPTMMGRFKQWMLFLLFRESPPRIQREAGLFNLLSVVGLLFIVFSTVAIYQGRPFPGKWALLPVLGASLLILAGPDAWVNRLLLARRPLVWVGLISYPLYLWHWPLLSFARIMASGTPSRTIRLAAVALAFLLAWLTYRLVEKPVRFGKTTRKKTALLVLMLVIVGGIGFHAYKFEGLSFRNSVKGLVQANAEFAWPPISTPECRDSFSKFTDGGFCQTTSPRLPTILIIGDSHAGLLFPGLAEMAEGSGEVVANWGVGGTPPFFDTKVIDGRDRLTLNKPLSFAESSDVVHTVILGSASQYISATKLRNVSHPELDNSEKAFEFGMRETLSRLLEKGKRVIFVLDSPSLGFNPKSCFDLRPLQLPGVELRSPCAVSRQVFDERNRSYHALVRRVLKDFPTVELFDAAASLCDDQWCWATKDGKTLYFDSGHLSIHGSRLVAQRLWPLLKK